MNMLRNVFQSDPQSALALSGFFIGLVFGAIAWRTNFCVMGAVSDWKTSGNLHRLGAVALAAAVAVVATQLLNGLALTDLTRSMYLTPRLNWLGATAGGLLFGFGMVSAGGCASRNLVRAGAGDLRGFITLLVLSVAAFATIGGVLGPLRTALDASTALHLEQFGLQSQSVGAIAIAFGVPAVLSQWLAPLLIAGPLAFFAFVHCRVKEVKASSLGGAVVGLLIAIGWLVTGLAFNDMDVNPMLPASLSFVRPVADTVDWIGRATALGLPGFGAATVFGTLAGSCLAANLCGRFQLQGFVNIDDMLRHLGGAMAMGIGGVLALGCSIGQGITGVSTLSVQSIIAACAILVGAAWALQRLERKI